MDRVLKIGREWALRSIQPHLWIDHRLIPDDDEPDPDTYTDEADYWEALHKWQHKHFLRSKNCGPPQSKFLFLVYDEVSEERLNELKGMGLDIYEGSIAPLGETVKFIIGTNKQSVQIESIAQMEEVLWGSL